MEEMAILKGKELQAMETELTDTMAHINLYEQKILRALENISQLRLEIQRQQEKLPALFSVQKKLTPQLNLRKRMQAKIQQGLEKKRCEFDIIKKAELEQSSGNEGSTYAEGLAKSGFVIDELWYENKATGQKMRASASPDITVSRDWKLVKMEAHTSRPIKIHFGLEENDLEARASGPHHLVAWMDGESPRLQLGALVPWAAVGWDGNGFRPYPHIRKQRVNLESAGEVIAQEITRYRSEICMGELSATASMAFNNNNPKPRTTDTIC